MLFIFICKPLILAFHTACFIEYFNYDHSNFAFIFNLLFWPVACMKPEKKYSAYYIFYSIYNIFSNPIPNFANTQLYLLYLLCFFI